MVKRGEPLRRKGAYAVGEVATDAPAVRKRLTLIGLGLIVAYVVGVQLLSLVRDRGWVTAGTLQALDRKGVFYLPDQRIFVVANGGHPVALSAVSPHLGERLLFCRSSGWFVDVHGDQFDHLGTYALGPAPRGMDRVAVRVEGDLVQVQPGAVTPGLPRGAGKPEPPSGPFCSESTTFGPFTEGPAGFVASPAP